MNQNNQNKANRSETKFERMDFYVPVGVILVELDPSNYNARIEPRTSENEVNNLIDTLGETTE